MQAILSDLSLYIDLFVRSGDDFSCIETYFKNLAIEAKLSHKQQNSLILQSRECFNKYSFVEIDRINSFNIDKLQNNIRCFMKVLNDYEIILKKFGIKIEKNSRDYI